MKLENTVFTGESKLAEMIAISVLNNYKESHDLETTHKTISMQKYWQNIAYYAIAETLKGRASISLKKLASLLSLLGKEISPEALSLQLSQFPWIMCIDTMATAMTSSPFVLTQYKLFMTRYWRAQQIILQSLKQINSYHQNTTKEYKHTQNLSQWLTPLHKSFSTSQQKIIDVISQKKSGITVVLGGAGSGKSWASTQMIKQIKKHRENSLIALCAPTGKAVSRLSMEFTNTNNLHIQTIHQLLKLHINSTSPVYHQENYLAYEYVLVDEVSMIDLELLALLLTAIRKDAKIIMLGDSAQLPPVGVGGSLELIEQHFPDQVVYLQEQHRFQEQSDIYQLSLLAKEGKLLQEPLPQNHTLSANEKEQQHRLEQWIKSHLIPCYQERNFHKLLNKVILSPWRHYENGILKLNQFVQTKLFNFNILQHSQGWCEGLPVVLKSNNNAQQVYNGDRGYLEEINNELCVIFPDKDNRSIPLWQLQQVEVAYAMTVHQTQGAEMDDVFLWLGDIDKQAQQWLSNQLLYTSITRAKKSLQICGNIHKE